MTKLNKEEIEHLIHLAGWLIAEGMAMFTHEDVKKFERIVKKWEEKDDI